MNIDDIDISDIVDSRWRLHRISAYDRSENSQSRR